MSNVTSSAYPVVTVTQSGDQFVIVQGGQLKKVTRSGLQSFIEQLAPNTILSLTDAPGSYVGQQGKALVVNPTEDAMVFEAATSGNFLALTDTPAGYGGNAGRLPVVNSGETALEFIDNFFIRLGDTPSSYTGQSEKIVRVNTGASAVEFVTPTQAAPSANLVGGFFDYNHGGGSQSYTGGTAAVNLLNDETGAFTNKAYAPPGVTDVWDATVNQFDFTELVLGDMVDIRIDLDITTTAVDQQINVELFLAIGSGADYQIPFVFQQVKTAATRQVVRFNGIYMGDTNTLNNPAEFRFSSPDDATIQVNGWYTKILCRGAV